VNVIYADVTSEGLIDTNTLKAHLSSKTVLVCYAYVNSEIGTIQPTTRIARIIREAQKQWGTQVYIHVDAAQAPLWVPCALDQIGADSIALDAGKCYGPKGVGVLAFIHGVTFAPLFFGGGQEQGLRPSTLNTPLIVGCAEALCIAQDSYKERAKAVCTLRNEFITQLLSIPNCVLNGTQTERVANNVNVSIEGVDAEFAVISLDEKGVACATKSACGSGKGDGSSVVRAISHDDARARSTIRFTLGEDTTARDLEATVAILDAHVAHMREATQYLTK
jgi:cysteine desulfurase